ncbi:MAG TPA: type II toxin-antitoxin system RelE/ParE family toxin [Stenotrophomonas sp.]|jgi:addiction module RelE/StbE family toxin
MRVLRWTWPAHKDRERIFNHIAGEDPEAAVKLSMRIHERARSLLDQPGIGRPGAVEGTRELVVHSHYVLVYAVTPSAITVVRVVHARQQWPAD